MLTPEQAREELDAHRVKDAEAQQVTAAGKLPKKLRRVAYALMGRDAAGKSLPGSPQTYQHVRQAQRDLDALKAADRMRIFKGAFPALAGHVEQAWQFMKQAPYQMTYQRKAFRAPTDPEITLSARSAWLHQMLTQIAPYQENIAWLADYAAYISPYFPTLGMLFAAVIDAGGAEGDQVFETLCASARGDHEIGGMGRHVVYGLLGAPRPEGWTLIENTLIAAQRQEGLRQVILEAVDFAHPQAFRRMLRLVIEHDLSRFSATVRAMNVWLGFGWDSENTRVINQTLERILTLLEEPPARAAALAQGDGEMVYLALWADAFEDVTAALPAATALLDDPDVERRFAAVHLLASLNIPAAQRALLPALDDPDLRVVLRACQGLRDPNLPPGSDLFERIERVIERLAPKSRLRREIIWPWMRVEMDKSAVAGILFKALEKRSPKRLIPHVGAFDEWGRAEMAKLIAPSWDRETRDTLLSLAGDRSHWVREETIGILAAHDLPPQDAPFLEGLLTRKVSDLRRGVLSLLVKQPDRAALASAERLLAASDALQRAAGLELLRLLSEADRAQPRCRSLASAYRTARGELTEDEAVHVRFILNEQADIPTLTNALGLINPGERSQPVKPQKRPVRLTSPAAQELVKSLDGLIHGHRTTPIMLETWQGEQEVLLGNAAYLPLPKPDLSTEENRARLPLREVWEAWWDERPRRTRDGDGLELARAFVMLYAFTGIYHRKNEATSAVLTLYEHELPRLGYARQVHALVIWLMWLHPVEGLVDVLLDVVETQLAAVREKAWKYISNPASYSRTEDWRGSLRIIQKLIQDHRAHLPAAWRDEHHARLWRLWHWADEPAPDVPRYRPELKETLAAYHAGAITEADLYDQLLGPRQYPQGFNELRLLSSRRPHRVLQEYPVLQGIMERCRERILEVELQRGDMPTEASPAALALRSVTGADTFVRLLRAMGRETFVRGYIFNNQSKAALFSHLIRVTFPREDDTPETFAQRAKEAKLSEKRLVEAAVYAPQWAEYVEHTIHWPHFADAVWWVHAHTKDTSWRVDIEIRAEWAAQIAERTPLSAQDLLDGAVDVAWFWRVYNGLGAERWKTLYEAAKYSAGGHGHARARLFADAMLGQTDGDAEIERMLKKRHQDSARALGLFPLAEGRAREADLLERYQALQEFLRTSRQFGSMRQANEKLAVRIGMENLARTAGYPDPLRLQWAMEAEEVRDLRQGPVVVTAEDVSLSLAVDDLGNPVLSVEKQGKRLKSVPAKLRKHPAIQALRDRKTAIEHQASRMRQSLEQAMCRGDHFTGSELSALLAHPVLAPMLEQVVFTGEDATGYLVEEGRALQSHDGSAYTIGTGAALRIAHPYDLFQGGEWPAWQRECFFMERIQPFKQIFRELYVLTEAEKQEGTISRRYAGHQVQPRQAFVLFGQRGWVAHPEEGVVRTFHDEGLSAHVAFLQTIFTPAEVEGLTLEGVLFARPGDGKPLPLTAIPPRIFSEVMRDLDLVVSVAHRGGVDPESSASTVEMRSALVRETCALLNVDNVRLQRNHALIEGQLGSYSVHLGSAIVHRQPGGALCIIPVHAQHRGRLFLPFADDDPKTAEVISKVVLLARDQDIKDPTILDQIRSMG